MALYEELLESGGIIAGDPRIEPGGEQHAAFEQLRKMGLVRQDASGGTWIAEDPDLVHSRVVSPLSQQGARLLEESTRWAQDFSALSQAWRKTPRAPERGPFTYLHGLETIGVFMHTVVPRCRRGGADGPAADRQRHGAGTEQLLAAERTMLERGGQDPHPVPAQCPAQHRDAGVRRGALRSAVPTSGRSTSSSTA